MPDPDDPSREALVLGLGGKEADHRTDIFALGVVLYEMATGKKAFSGESQASLIAAILDREPVPMSTLKPMTPPTLDHVVRRCLEKDPDDRWQSTGDVRHEVTWIIEGGSQPSVTVPGAGVPQRASRRQGIPLAFGALLVGGVVTGIAVWSLTRRAPAPSRLERFTIFPPSPETVAVATTDHDIAISPDGTQVVFRATGRFQLYARAVDNLTAVPFQLLGGTGVFAPFVSSDGAWVGFSDESDGTLKKVSIRGGPPLLICRTGSPGIVGAAWGADDMIIFGTDTDSGLWRVSADGGEPEQLTTPNTEQGQVNHGWPHILPGGRAVLFTILRGGAVEDAQIAVLNLDTREQRVLVPGGSFPRYSPTGHIVYGVSRSLWAVSFDLDRLAVTNADPVPVLDGVVTKASGAANFDIARDGSLVYVASADPQRTLVWVDRQGQEEPVAAEPRPYTSLRISPDGTAVALEVADPDNTDVWIQRFASGTLTRLTVDPSVDRYPLWTQDDRVIWAATREGGERNLFWRAADGAGQDEQLTSSPIRQSPIDVSSDGTLLVLVEGSADESVVSLLSLTGDQEVRTTPLQTPFARLSPDGRWIAYTSRRSGRVEVYVRPFPDVGGGEVPISQGGGDGPEWSPDGHELFYQSPEGMMVVAVDTEPSLRVRTSELLFEWETGTYRIGSRQYDVARDGRRFLMIKQDSATNETSAQEIILVQNWFTELQRLVPTP